MTGELECRGTKMFSRPIDNRTLHVASEPQREGNFSTEMYARYGKVDRDTRVAIVCIILELENRAYYPEVTPLASAR